MENIDLNNVKEKTLCPVCNNDSVILNDKVKTINNHSDFTVSLRKCLTCGHWFIDPMPKQNYLNKLYESGSGFVVEENYKGSEDHDHDDLKKYISRFVDLNSDISKLNYLEIGVGPGHLYNYFKDKVSICYGVDPCTYKPEGKYMVSDISEVPDNIKFDIVIIQDVLEHLENPTLMLKTARKMVNDNAIISLGFPNCDCIMAKLLKEKWSMVRPFGHLHYFSAESIKIMFENSGWKIKRKYSYWPAPSATYYISNFEYKSKNPLRLLYRIFRDLIFKQLLFGKDQWYVCALTK
ncbi:MAG: class I SAM-dependent methyltransferase [Mesotoga sp.]|nr:class I SAM-dependent methyltransferase [Mesotoga sp.]